MKYKRIAIFTKTNWDEPPRIRHQLTNLLLSYGHEVMFFEKSNLKQFKISKNYKNNILFIKHFELLHHQLRPFKFLVKINAFVTKLLIKKAIKDEKIDLVINFNYDYYFLKEIFEEQKIVTIINDDFVAQARPWMTSAIRQQLQKTSQNSDAVFSVSYPLDNQLKVFDSDAKLFFPWAGQKYIAPKDMQQKRDVILYWGYIDNRIDWTVVEYLLKQNIKLRFIGMLSSKVNSLIESFKKYDNFEIHNPQQLSEIKLDEVCCSLLPYVNASGEMKAVTVNNRVFQLLSYGIPLVYVRLPYLIEAPISVITKCEKNEEYLEAIEYFKENFMKSQSDIKCFLENHYGEERYEYFFKSIEDL